MNVVLTEIVSGLESGARPKGGVNGIGDIPSLGAEHLDDSGNFNFKNLKKIPLNYYNSLRSGKIEINDILIVKDGATTGKTSFVSEDFPYKVAALNEHVFRIKINNSVAHPKYVFYLLNSNIGYRQIMNDFHGATVGGISRNFVKKITIPLPPLSDQQRIASILDHADAIRRKNSEILEKYDKLAQSVFYEMFGDPVRNTKNWDKLSGDEYCVTISVGVVIKPASYYVSEGICALRSLNIKPNKIILNDLVYFSRESNETYLKKSKIRSGDVLIVRTGQPGTSAVVPDCLDGSNCIDLIIARPNKNKVNSTYLSHFFNSTGGRTIVIGTQKGQIQKHFNIGEIKKATIPVPPIFVQNKFVTTIKMIESEREICQQNLSKSEELFQSLLQRAFRGEL